MKIEAKITKDNGEEYVINGEFPTNEEIEMIFPTDKSPENKEIVKGAKWFRNLFVRE